MLKKLISFAIAFMMFFVYGFALAEEWTCDACGTTNTTNFCGNCGAKKPSDEWECPACGYSNTTNFCANCGQQKPSGDEKTSDSTITDIKFTDNYNGSITITWKDSADKGPYEVFFTTDDWVNYSTKYGVDNTKTKSLTTYYLIPGNTYHITVRNGVSSTTADYSVARRTFTDFSTGKQLELDKDQFAISGQGYYQTFRMTVWYPQLSKPREYNYLLALKTPRGYASIINAYNPYTMDKQYRGIYEDMDLSSFLDCIKANFGEIMRGEYIFEVYFDGNFYASKSIYIYP